MIFPVLVTPAAKKDLFEIADFIADQSLDSGLRFLDKVETSFQKLAEMPELGAVCPFRHAEITGIRVRAVTGFPNHLIFYRVETEQICVIRVLHGSQDWENII
jgi:toxin ParE1/3/4